MYNQIKFEQALIGAKMNHSQFADYLGISRDALRRKARRGNFDRDQISKMRKLFGVEVCEGFLFDPNVA